MVALHLKYLDPERSSFEVRRLTMNGRASSQIARSRTVVIWGHIKYQALYRLSTGYEHPAYGITKHTFLLQGMFWGAKCYPAFWQSRDTKRLIESEGQFASEVDRTSVRHGYH